MLNHGGGPMPLLGQAPGLAGALREWSASLTSKPKAILLVSAHWEEPAATVHSGASPSLLFDYSGFPAESYEYKYAAPGAPSVAARALELLKAAGIASATDAERGWDHGVFVPMMLAFPDADVPIVQLSLLQSLDAAAHFALGRALRPLRDEGVAVVGSGQTFHNMGAFFGQPLRSGKSAAEVSGSFDSWFTEACASTDAEERQRALIGWESAPGALECHPRSEHWLPLLVVVGAAHGDEAGRVIYTEQDMMGQGIAMSNVQFG